MAKIKVGLLSFSDARVSVHESLRGDISKQAQIIREALESTGEIEVVEPESGLIHSNGLARQCAKEIKAQLPDVVVFNIAVFAFPNFSVIAESVLKMPTLLISNVDGLLPGLGGVQASTNFLRQVGYTCEKVWGNISKPEVLDRCLHYIRAAYAVNQLHGQVYGIIGGRSLGMGSGVPPLEVWQSKFGVDVDHTDQSEILRRAELVCQADVDRAYDWLVKTTNVAFDDDKLTEQTLKQQIRHYYATKDICEEKSYEFVGVKCHYELSAHSCTQCLAAAFFNDPYDWDGEKATRVYSCEADSDAGLTMQVMKLVSGLPVLFADFRFYKEESNIFYFCNCGSMSTWFADRSEKPEDNLAKVTLSPIIPKYQGKGCHVTYIAKEGRMTFGRITHEKDHYIFTVFTGTAKELPGETMKDTCEVWPHMFVEADPTYQAILDKYDCNHVHALYGDWTEEIRHFCELKGMEFRLIK